MICITLTIGVAADSQQGYYVPIATGYMVCVLKSVAVLL
jgi:hypothetical protein